jgi:hypothetical protein
MYQGRCIAAIVSKLDQVKGILRGYIAMLAVAKEFRKCGIGKFNFFRQKNLISTRIRTC